MAKYKRGSLTLARQVFNTPQLILADDLQNIAQYLVNRANGVEFDIEPVVVEEEARAPLTDDEQQDRTWRRLGISNNGKRGNLEVTGTLVAKAGNIDADCMELTSYESLYDTFTKQVQEGVEELVLYVDSGGGSAFTCFEMAREVKSLAVENNIKIYAYVDGLSASAAYAWASIADEIIARPDSEVGSVGVVVQLINNSKMLENIGITRQFVCHGEQKVPFTDKGEFSAQFISNIQKKVDKTGLEFSTFIAENRGMRVEDVLATQAEVFDSEEALSVGFIDKVMTKSEFFNNYLPNASANNSGWNYTDNGFGLNKGNDNSTKEGTMKNSEQQAPQTDESLSNTHVTKTEGSEDMTKELTSQLAEFKLENTNLSEQLSALTEKLQVSESKVEELSSAMQEKELEHRMNQREAKLKDALGEDNEKVAELLSNTESLSDAQFDSIAESLANSQVDKQKQLSEHGGEGQEANKQLDLAEQMKAKAQAMYSRKA